MIIGMFRLEYPFDPHEFTPGPHRSYQISISTTQYQINKSQEAHIPDFLWARLGRALVPRALVPELQFDKPCDQTVIGPYSVGL